MTSAKMPHVTIVAINFTSNVPPRPSIMLSLNSAVPTEAAQKKTCESRALPYYLEMNGLKEKKS